MKENTLKQMLGRDSQIYKERSIGGKRKLIGKIVEIRADSIQKVKMEELEFKISKI